MQNRSVFYSGILLVTAALWGFSFVAQRAGMDHIGPFLFNAIRFALGAISLVPLYFYQKKKERSKPLSYSKKSIWRGGLVLGSVLFVAASLQQIGMQYTTAVNGGFITSLYVVLVPFISVFLKRRISLLVWIGSLFALIGLYLLSVTDGLHVGWGDGLVLISALFWAIHVILIGNYANKGAIILLSIIQFAITSIFSFIVAIPIEPINWENIVQAGIPILYGGIVSVGIAYTLQVFAQKEVAPEKSAIILSFESAFAMLGGWWLLSEVLSMRSLIGASFMLIGIIVSQIKWKKI